MGLCYAHLAWELVPLVPADLPPSLSLQCLGCGSDGSGFSRYLADVGISYAPACVYVPFGSMEVRGRGLGVVASTLSIPYLIRGPDIGRVGSLGLWDS